MPLIRVMIVDDELLVRIGLKNGINWDELGCQVVGEAADGDEALELYSKLKPDLVFLDIGMPRMDGIAFFERAKAQDHQARFVMLSSHSDFELVKRALQLGALDYIHKLRFTETDIAQIIERLPPSASASNLMQELCPPLELGAVLRNDDPYLGRCSAFFIEEASCEWAEYERIVQNVLGEVLRDICPVYALIEEHGCLALIADAPSWMNEAKVIEISSRLEESLRTCGNGHFLVSCSGICISASEAISEMRRHMALNHYVRAALRRIDAGYAKPLTLHSISRDLGLNESYFAFLFKKEIGVSFTTYLNRYRINRAKELLRYGWSIKDAAYSVGFENIPYFHRVYKHFTGETPFRDKSLKEDEFH
ncbi:MAG: response regulator [Clostridiales bacterium]|jgi:two-component system response regulator YesN|nr:response regulator [Clostridiales bacterium]